CFATAARSPDTNAAGPSIRASPTRSTGRPLLSCAWPAGWCQRRQVPAPAGTAQVEHRRLSDYDWMFGLDVEVAA
ncbi:hypothetical protein ACIBEF_32430, partial [Micromonospora sp. NPDC050795]|uniref:hypothetical protein n=1 Tax=Micromonospora sp. NPDC050795 TaxID=3364282 RepID=UPI0037AA41BC